MSTPGVPASPATSVFRLTGNSAIDSLIGIAMASASLSLATWAIDHLDLKHVDATTLSLAIFGVLATLATAGWKYFNSRINSAVAVNAGVQAAVLEGAKMQSVGGGTSIVAPVTPASAAEIVKNYGSVQVKVSDEPGLTDKLNATQIPGN